MRIFYSFLIIATAAILWLLPIDRGVYAYKTDERTDTFTVITGAAENSANVQLTQPIYGNDTATLSFISYDTDDAPLFSSYNTTNRQLTMSGLAADTTRSMDVTYDVDAIAGDALDDFLNNVPTIWIILVVAFPVGGLAAIWTGRA